MQPMRLLFDLDGTLLDTAPDLYATLNHCLKTAGRDPVTLESVKHMVGQGAVVLLKRGLVATGGMVEEEEFQNLVDLFFSHYGDNLSDHSIPYEGMQDCLDILKEQGHSLSVCTNKPYGFAKQILDDFNLSSYFDALTGGDSFDIRKPHPDHIHKTLDLMSLKSGTAVMIGDTHNDIDAAVSAGIGSIAVTFGYSDTPATELGADHVIDHFDKLIPTLKKY